MYRNKESAKMTVIAFEFNESDSGLKKIAWFQSQCLSETEVSSAHIHSHTLSKDNDKYIIIYIIFDSL